MERRNDGYNHYGFVDVPHAMWQPVLADWAALRLSLEQAANGGPDVSPPFGSVCSGCRLRYSTSRTVNCNTRPSFNAFVILPNAGDDRLRCGSSNCGVFVTL